MPYQLRIDPKRYYRQTEQDQKVGSLECCSSACVPLAFARAENGIFLPGCGVAPVFSLLRRPFSHPAARLSHRLDAQNAQIVSQRVLSRPGCSDVVFALYDREEIGPRMLTRIDSDSQAGA